MQHSRITAAEEIQLLLPDNQPVHSDYTALLLLSLGVVFITLPLAGGRLLGARWRD